ncbi:MAG: large subunit ribosomal protein L25 [Parcubacteria group bacterium Gr01-1014_56]|nr:MAG: large subunit ribosomal protein L25 [Parcubacteria group bacterium Gr01-1014_56]
MELQIEKRDIAVKPHALRKKGLLPAVVYGRSEESTPIVVERKAFEKLFHMAGESTVITLQGLGENKDALIQEVTVDPVTGVSIHADFYAIEKGQTVTVAIPFEFIGESPAVKDLGGILVKVMHELEITCQPKDLPHSFKVDISKLAELTDQIKVKDLAIPAAAQISIDVDEVIAMIDVAKEEPVEEVAADISAIEISEDRGKKEEEGEAGTAPPTPAAKEKKE